jgi:hypothetical protein
MDDPVMGIRIRSAAGSEVMGTNTKIEKISTGSFMRGKDRVIVWEMPNILADGDYYIDPAIIDPDGITVQDWWDESVKVKIKKDRRLPYTVDPGFKIYFSNKL